MNQDFYNSNLSGFDQFQPSQLPTIHQSPQETDKEILQAREDLMEAIEAILKEKFSRISFGVTPKVILIAWERFGEIKHALTDKQYRQEDIQELMSKLLKDVRNISEELSEYINCPSWNRPIFYDNDDDEYTIIYRKPKVITPDLPIEEPDNSLIMGDEHLDTIPSIENLVPIPSEFEGTSDDACDVPICEDPSTFDALNDHSEILSYSNDDDTSSDDDSFEDIEYVSLEEVNNDQEEKEFDLEDILQIQDIILRDKLLNISRLITNIEALNENPSPGRVLKSPSLFPIPVEDSDSFFEKYDTYFSFLDNSLPEFETFSYHTKETRSGSTTTHANNSLPEYDSFLFELANRSITYPKGLAKDVFVKVGKFHFPTDFVVVDFKADPRVPLILGRSFLRTGHALIDVYGEEITLRVDNEAVTFNLDQTTRYSSTNDKSVNRIDIIDAVCEEYAPELLGISNSSGGNPTPMSEPFTSEFILEAIESYLKDDLISPEIDYADCNPEEDICLIEKLLNNDPFQLPPFPTLPPCVCLGEGSPMN
ncbi:reverse transcriptase domain-containing protein [Tanacetum coccineum]